jgi:hypothetical protein
MNHTYADFPNFQHHQCLRCIQRMGISAYGSFHNNESSCIFSYYQMERSIIED